MILVLIIGLIIINGLFVFLMVLVLDYLISILYGLSCYMFCLGLLEVVNLFMKYEC